MTNDNFIEEKARRQRGNILFAFAIALVLYFAYLLREELTLLYVSALCAVVLRPLASGIMRIRIRNWHPGVGLSVIVLLAAVLGGITLFAMFALPPAFHDLRQFVADLPTRGPELFERLKRLPFLQHLNVDALNARVQDFASNFASYVFKTAGDWAHKAFDIITGIVLTLYFMIEGDKAYAWGLRLVPLRHRARLDRALTRADVRMGRWLLGQGTLMLILGVTSTIVFSLLHVRYAYALGVLMGLFNIIPVVGAMITVSLAILVAAIDSWGRVLGVIIFYGIYAQLETSILTPRIMQSSVDLAGLAILVALLLGSALAGVAGAAVSVPTAVLVAVLIEEYLVDGQPIVATVPADSAPLPR
jgi:predicted PurR-regulated permease PerM